MVDHTIELAEGRTYDGLSWDRSEANLCVRSRKGLVVG